MEKDLSIPFLKFLDNFAKNFLRENSVKKEVLGMKPLCLFAEGERIVIRKIVVRADDRARLISLGIGEGTEVEIFFKDAQKTVLRLGTAKVALCESISLNIRAERSDAP